MKIILCLAACAFLLATSVIATPRSALQHGLICGDPTDTGCSPQYDFEPHELPFLTGRAELGAGKRHESGEFYAVILESVKAASSKNAAGCNFISEAKRQSAQKLFPRNRIFTSRNLCRGTIVSYTNTNAEFNFMAIYGGSTKDEAEAILLKAKKQYPQANLRRISIVLDFADE